MFQRPPGLLCRFQKIRVSFPVQRPLLALNTEYKFFKLETPPALFLTKRALTAALRDNRDSDI